MDNTPIFIKMCEKAVEVQEFMKHERGTQYDFFEIEILDMNKLSKESNCPDRDPCKECCELGKFNRTTYTSMEQLWLAFVMKELYSKQWNGNNWIKI